MHDPHTQVTRIRIPIPFRRLSRQLHQGGWIDVATIWHKDPCSDGSDDSCGWFMRSRHGDPATLQKITEHFLYDWEKLFNKHGDPLQSTIAISLYWYRIAAFEVFRHNQKRRDRWLKKNLYRILSFAENPYDSLNDIIQGIYHDGTTLKKGRAQQAASTVYADLLRATRPWWKHPRFHLHHWKVSFHLWQSLSSTLLPSRVSRQRWHWEKHRDHE